MPVGMRDHLSPLLYQAVGDSGALSRDEGGATSEGSGDTVIFYILYGIAIAILALFTWALCRIAAQSDEDMKGPGE